MAMPLPCSVGARMAQKSIKELGEALARAGRLTAKPLCIYGADEPPMGGIPIGKVHRCIPRAIMMVAVKDHPPLYIGNEFLDGCCPGGQTWLGYVPISPGLKHFISFGSPTFRNGAAEYLKATPDLVEESWKQVGKITPLANVLVITTTEKAPEDAEVRSVLLFGNGEQVRNLCALNHFCTSDVYSSILMPWGPTCSTFISYPAGLAEKAPKDALFVGPVDPTSNEWFPPSMMAVAMPILTARRLVENLDASFIMKRPKVAYPEQRDAL